MGARVSLHGGTNRLYVAEEGRHDEQALRAFTEGQCHGFALALHRSKAWPLVAIDDADGTCVHICARDPDGRLVDIRGFHPEGKMPIGNGRTLREVDEEYLFALTNEEWSVADPDGAAPWVKPVLDRSSQPVLPMPRRFGMTLYPPGGYELRSIWDGEIDLPASARLRSRSVQWVAYDGVRVPRDAATGRNVIDVTPDAFEEIMGRALREFDRAQTDRKLDNLLGAP
jgi:hypothetical protein